MSAIEIKHLKLIKTIAKTENLTQAARKLFITQSALSRQLIDIENRLGINLFLRTQKRMILTEEGDSLLVTANSVLDELEQAERKISKIVNGETGKLKIGVQCLFCFEWLPRVMKMFQDRYPNIDLSLSRTRSLQKDLKAGKTDLVISAIATESACVDFHPLFEDEIAVVMSPDHPFGAKRFLTARDFVTAKLISLTDKSQDYFYQRILVKEGIEPKAFMSVEQVDAVVELVKAGFGISLLPQRFVRALLNSDQLKAASFRRRGLFLTWKAVHLKKENLPAHQKEFIRLLTDWTRTATV
ncbi:MAG: LysR family transcriptional regulator [Proteobacteria bacterium]|nr:LysR family transcriptional regulator [Pseudomonadota bacterium]